MLEFKGTPLPEPVPGLHRADCIWRIACGLRYSEFVVRVCYDADRVRSEQTRCRTGLRRSLPDRVFYHRVERGSCSAAGARHQEHKNPGADSARRLGNLSPLLGMPGSLTRDRRAPKRGLHPLSYALQCPHEHARPESATLCPQRLVRPFTHFRRIVLHQLFERRLHTRMRPVARSQLF